MKEEPVVDSQPVVNPLQKLNNLDKEIKIINKEEVLDNGQKFHGKIGKF